MSTAPTPSHDSRGIDSRVLVGVVVTAAVVVIGLTWAKWQPYLMKIDGLVDSRAWDGGALVDLARDAPTWWQGAWDFTLAYTDAVWKALLVGLLIAAAIDALVPRERLRRVLAGRNSTTGAAIAGAASLPGMMCTCCASPVAVSLRRSGVPVSSVVAFWLGNPVLNPAVLVFLALVGPWEWAVTRLVVGIALVLGAATLAGWLVPGRRVDPATADLAPTEEDAARPSLARFVRSLVRFSVTLVPEYLVLVMLVGAAAHVFSFDAAWVTGGGIALLAVAAVVVLLVIPTGGEIPVLLALAAIGASPWVLGLVLLALPAVSLPSLLMVGRSLTWRVTAATAGAVVVAGLLAGAGLAVVA
ncbi:MAG TPA: permease [Candidatus Janibacter merdipullorum]|nr:permease [Candidatus Janibacter merdipullorum]